MLNPKMAVPKNQSNSDKKNKSGSLANSEPEFLEIGRIGKTHGLRGDLWLNLSTDFPERLGAGKIIYIGKKYQEFSIGSFRLKGNRGLLKFAEFNSPEKARVLTNQSVYVKTKDLPDLPKDEYYHHDLIGIRVVDEEQKEIGILEEILRTGANDVYVVKHSSGKETLVPAIKSVIIDINTSNKTMIVRLQEWA